MYLQDEWKLATDSDRQLRPAFRSVHGLYQRQPGESAPERRLAGAARDDRARRILRAISSPPPFELVGGKTVAMFSEHHLAATVAAAPIRRWPNAPITTISGAAENQPCTHAGTRHLLQAVGTT